VSTIDDNFVNPAEVTAVSDLGPMITRIKRSVCVCVHTPH